MYFKVYVLVLLIFRLFLLAFNIFQAVFFSFVPIVRVFSCQKIRDKWSELVFILKELNLAHMSHFRAFRGI